MPNPENIIPPKKGEVRNPKGKPKGTLNRSTIIRNMIESNLKYVDPITGEEILRPIYEHMTAAMLKEVLSGNVAAFKELMDGGFGKVKDESNVNMRMEGFSIKDIYNEKTQTDME